MNLLLFIIPALLLHISPLPAQAQPPQIERYGFEDLHLGMPISEFKVNHPATPTEYLMTVYNEQLKHPGTASCSDISANGITVCSYVDARDPLEVTATFVDGKLAEISAQDDHAETDGLQFCFNPIAVPDSKPFEKHQYSLICPKFSPLWKALTGNLGQVKIIGSPKNEPSSPDPLYAMWWQDDTSVAEFQDHQCLPIEDKDGALLVDVGQQISEVLKEEYCGTADTLSYRQVTMMYFDKALSQTLAIRLQHTVQ